MRDAGKAGARGLRRFRGKKLCEIVLLAFLFIRGIRAIRGLPFQLKSSRRIYGRSRRRPAGKREYWRRWGGTRAGIGEWTVVVREGLPEFSRRVRAGPG